MIAAICPRSGKGWNGFQVGASYKAEGGFENDTVVLAYRITLPKP